MYLHDNQYFRFQKTYRYFNTTQIEYFDYEESKVFHVNHLNYQIHISKEEKIRMKRIPSGKQQRQQQW